VGRAVSDGAALLFLLDAVRPTRNDRGSQSEERGQNLSAVAEARASASWERWAPLTGVLAVALWLAGIAVWESAIDDGNAASLLHSYREHENSILIGGWLWLLGTFAFAWFVGSLRVRLAGAEGEARRLTGIAFAGGIAVIVFGFAMPGPDMAAAIANGANLSEPAAEAIRVIADVIFIGAEMAAAVLLAATGILIWRTRALHRGVAWFSLFVALVLVILPIGWAALLFGVPLWVLLVSAMLWRRAKPATT